MSEKAPFEVIVGEDNLLMVDISDEFAALPREEQLKVMEKFFWERTLPNREMTDVTTDLVKEEITIVLAESMMAQLKRGEAITKDGQIDITLEDLADLKNILT